MDASQEEDVQRMVPVVGIGASAGGLEAISRLLDAAPADTGCAFVVIVHLDPRRESAFAPLLARRTSMPVVEITDGMAAEPNRVHVIVPNRTPTIAGGKLWLHDRGSSPAERNHPIDAFFESMAVDLQQKAVGIVLSGTGRNGTHGLRHVKARGGLTLVQDPETAEFDGMPSSAIASGAADLVLAPDKMPESLLRWLRHSHIAETPEPPARTSDQPGTPAGSTSLQRILTLLHTREGHVFATYKRAMLLRRIHRRMRLSGTATRDDYLQRLLGDPAEISALVTDLMITITAFFRDPEAWATLDASVLAPLVAERPAGAEVRFWVPACASGEEAYSLAMLMLDRAEAAGKSLDIKIFATDPQEKNLASARVGIYPAAATERISPDRLARYFHRLDDAYQVRKELRDRIVFARHDLLGNPPFSRLDLISCRNLLIYLDVAPQRRAMSLFHFALRPGGALFLGNAETIGHTGPLYEPISSKWRIYRRLDAPRLEGETIKLLSWHDRVSGDGADILPLLSPPPADGRIAEMARHALLAHYAPASVLIEPTGRILYFHGATGAYLQQPSGEPSLDLLVLVRSTLRRGLRRAIARAITSGETVAFNGPVPQDDTLQPTSVTVTPIAAAGPPPPMLLVSFQPARTLPTGSAPTETAEESPAAIQALEDELNSTRSELQRVIEQLQDVNEGLKAANEEVTSMNEELQSTNEELETSKEELYSYSEELQAINKELNAKILEKNFLSDKLENLLDSTDIATLFLDPERRIEWFSPACTQLFDLLPGDIGRSIDSFAWKFADAALLADATMVFEKLITIESEVKSSSGRWYLRRIHPHRTRDSRVTGTVITFTDISDRKEAADAVDVARVYAETIVETIRQPLLVLDADFCIRSANRAFCSMFCIPSVEAENRIVFELQGRKWDVPQIRALLEEVARAGVQIEDVFVEQDFAIVGHRALLISARPLPGCSESSGLILLAIEDVTGRLREAQLQHDAAHDELTGLPNRREFMRRLRRAVLNAQQHDSEHALCYVDLDQFKLINDTAGHAAGDALLQQVRPLLTGLFRERDTLARMGGDEFAILLNNCPLAEATRIAESVIATLRDRRFEWEGRSFQVGASAGVVAITRRSESVAEILSQADVACYAAKEGGRNRVMAYDGQKTLPSAHHAQIVVAATLRQALDRNRFRLFAQAIVPLTRPGRDRPHYEVLVRMLDEEDRLILPNAFIPAAERFGLMHTIDRWVIDTAFGTYARSNRTAEVGDLSVNLSGASLDADGLTDFVLDRLTAYGLPADRICFEITETAAIRNLDHTAAFLRELKARGSRCAMDDFGNGMAPFRYLRALPVDFLKIDGTFVKHMDDDPRDEAMVAAINEMAHSLGIATIAEHAHSEAIVDRLRHLGVDYAQGYAIGVPVPLDSVL